MTSLKKSPNIDILSPNRPNLSISISPNTPSIADPILILRKKLSNQIDSPCNISTTTIKF